MLMLQLLNDFPPAGSKESSLVLFRLYYIACYSYRFFHSNRALLNIFLLLNFIDSLLNLAKM
jgi:hypothetical protein